MVEADSDDEDVTGAGEEDGEEEDEDLEEEEEEEEADEDAEGDVDADLLAAEDSEEDAEGEEDDDAEMEEATHPPRPVIKSQPAGTKGKGKTNVTVSMPNEGMLKSVEDKELDDEDDELSDLESGEEDAEGGDDEELDSDEEDEETRTGTPDLDKMTRRQRAQYEENLSGGLMALSNGTQKHCTHL